VISILKKGIFSIMSLRSIKEGWFKARHEKNALPRYVARRYLFSWFEQLGLHVVGDHFYEPIPNLREVERNYREGEIEIPGHDFDLPNFESGHVARLERYAAEFEQAVKAVGFDPLNYYFYGADAVSYYCFLREQKPDSVVEVGQGSSTRVALAALERNAAETGVTARLVSVDPYARLLADEVGGGLSTQFECVQQGIQDFPVEELLRRCEGRALLFIDSSHVHKYCSDVWHLMRFIYPKLPVGCFLHVHDIVLPLPWPKTFYTERKWFWNEQDSLESFLAFNAAFEVVLPVHWLHEKSVLVRQTMQRLASELPNRDSGYSFYLKRVK
jgi:cephalosporin hydroxylase